MFSDLQREPLQTIVSKFSPCEPGQSNNASTSDSAYILVFTVMSCLGDAFALEHQRRIAVDDSSPLHSSPLDRSHGIPCRRPT